MSKVFTNKVNTIVNKENLAKDFKLYEIKSLNNKNIFTHIYSDKEFANNVIACCYMGKDTVFVLVEKTDTKDYFKYNNNISIISKNILDMDDIILLNLILIICTNQKYNINKDPLSNVDGQCYLYVNSKKDEMGNEILTLNLRFYKKENEIILRSDLKTFTKFDFFPENLQDKYSALSKFHFTEQKTFIRTNEKENAYIRKSKQNIPKYKHEKNSINEFEFSNEKFRSCRIFSYYKIYELFQNCKYIKEFSFVEDCFTDIPKLSKKDNLPTLTITPHTLCIVNTTSDNEIDEKIIEMLNSYTASYPDIVLQKQDIHNMKKDINYRYLIVTEKKENDIHHNQPDIIKQCIAKNTIEKAHKTFLLNMKKGKIKLPQSLENALMELQIKNDLYCNFINFPATIKEYGKITALCVNIKEDFYSTIAINSDGNIIQKSNKNDLFMLEEKFPQLWHLCDPFNEDNIDKVKTFLIIDDTTYEMVDSSIKVLPNIEKVSERLTVDNGINQTVSYFIEHIIKSKIDKSIKKISNTRKSSLVKIEDFFNDKLNNLISAREFIDNIKNECCVLDEKTGKYKKNAYIDDIIECFDENNILVYESFRRNQSFLENIFGCYYLSGYKNINDKFLFFMQPRNPQDAVDNTVANANIVHCIQNINNEPITKKHIDIFLWLLCVTFVKFNCYSTKPFLFKYLDELGKIEKEKEE